MCVNEGATMILLKKNKFVISSDLLQEPKAA
jgi:hypothetical protein